MISKIRLPNSFEIDHDSSVRLTRRPGNRPLLINSSRRLVLKNTRRLSVRKLAFHTRPQLARIPGTMRRRKITLIPLKVATTLPTAHRKTSPTDPLFRLRRRAIQNLGNLRLMSKTRPSVKRALPDLSPLQQSHMHRNPRLRCRKPSHQIWLNRGSRIGCETPRCIVVITAIRVRIIPTTDQIATAHNQCRTAKRSSPGFPPPSPPDNHINALPKHLTHPLRQ